MVLSTNELLLHSSPCLSSFSLCLAVTLSMNTSHVLLNSCQPCKILVTKLAGISVIAMPGAGVVASKVRKQREAAQSLRGNKDGEVRQHQIFEITFVHKLRGTGHKLYNTYPPPLINMSLVKKLTTL